MNKILSLTLIFVLALSIVPFTNFEYNIQAQEVQNNFIVSLHENINVKQASSG